MEQYPAVLASADGQASLLVGMRWTQSLIPVPVRADPREAIEYIR